MLLNVFEVFGKIFEKLEVWRRIVCSSSNNLVFFHADKKHFEGTEPLFVQYLGESTVFGVKSMTK